MTVLHGWVGGQNRVGTAWAQGHKAGEHGQVGRQALTAVA